MVIIGVKLARRRYASRNYKDYNLAFKINKNCIAIGENGAPKIAFGPGKLSGVSRNGALELVR